jgi:pSer/pThr/pTyr-binding forkhead associated (FHA) protein
MKSFTLKRDYDDYEKSLPESPDYLTVGRSKNNDIVTTSDAYIEKHYAVFRKDSGCYLKDFGYGTSVDNQLNRQGEVVGKTIRIFPGDRIMSSLPSKNGKNVCFTLEERTI